VYAIMVVIKLRRGFRWCCSWWSGDRLELDNYADFARSGSPRITGAAGIFFFAFIWRWTRDMSTAARSV
jgi:hypothetical protein